MQSTVKYKPYKHNPRKISKDQLEKLEDTLRRLGDLSGIIHNIRSDQFIGGNQRSKAINFDECEIEIIEEFDKPDDQGTIAWGFVIWEGHRYGFRRVKWSAKIEREANIIANKGGGDWDFDVLKEHFKSDDLLEWGFKPNELSWIDQESKQPLAINIEPLFQVVVDCKNEADQEKVFNLLTQHNYSCRILTL